VDVVPLASKEPLNVARCVYTLSHFSEHLPDYRRFSLVNRNIFVVLVNLLVDVASWSLTGAFTLL
jgi:hypothetical protein